jgi:hypothetical protein
MDRIAGQVIFGRLLACAAIGVVVAQIDGQPPPGAGERSPSFEVAAIKPLAPPFPSSGKPWTVSHGRYIAQAVWLRVVIGWAYDVLGAGSVPTVKVHGGPAWIDTDRYDFEAKAEDPNAAQTRLGR